MEQNIETNNSKNELETYIKDYFLLYKRDNATFYQNSSEEDLNIQEDWKNFFEKNRHLISNTINFFVSKIELGKDVQIDFHDGFWKNIKKNLQNDFFSISLLTHQYENYKEIEPIWLTFNIDNKERNKFRTLTKLHTILTLVYDGNHIGMVMLDKNWKPKMIFLDNIDLSNVKTEKFTPIKKIKSSKI